VIRSAEAAERQCPRAVDASQTRTLPRFATLSLSGYDDNTARTKSLKMISELAAYLERNRYRLPSYAERRLAGEPISSAPAESAVNQIIAKRMVKKQQMRWTPAGAHRLLQIRTRVLDHQLDNDITRWHPTQPIGAGGSLNPGTFEAGHPPERSTQSSQRVLHERRPGCLETTECRAI